MNKTELAESGLTEKASNLGLRIVRLSSLKYRLLKKEAPLPSAYERGRT